MISPENNVALTQLLDSEYYRTLHYAKDYGFAPDMPYSYAFRWNFGRCSVAQKDYNEIELSYVWYSDKIVSIRFLDFGLSAYENACASVRYFLDRCEGASTITPEEVNFLYDVLHVTKGTLPYVFTYLGSNPYYRPQEWDKKYFHYYGHNYYRKFSESLKTFFHDLDTPNAKEAKRYKGDFYTEDLSGVLSMLLRHKAFPDLETAFLSLPEDLLSQMETV